MREEEDSSWFTKWEQELPSPEELIPISQSLITPDLAIAFDLHTQTLPQPQTNNSASPDFPGGGGDSSTGDDQQQARTLKRPRLVWTPQLHKRFVDAVAHLGIKNAVPKTIMQLMSVDGLTRENVASHLQKYRLYLKRMQSGVGSNVVGESDHLFATSHFLHPTGRQNSDHQFMSSFVPIATHQQQQQQQFFHRQVSAPNFKVMDQSLFLARQNHQGQVMRPSSLHLHSQVGHYKEDLQSGDNKAVLTLFPTRDD